MKKKGKKLISIALTVAMIAGLTACGKGNGGGGQGAGTETVAAVRPMPALQNSMYLRNRRWILIWIQTI